MLDALPTGDVSRFRPKTLRQFLIFHIALRFDDLRNLGRYLNTCVTPNKSYLIAIAKCAEDQSFQDGSHAPQNFWRILAKAEQEAA